MTGDIKAEDPIEPVRKPATFDSPGAFALPKPLTEPPRPPVLPAALQMVEKGRQQGLHERETLERRSVLRGLIFLAILVLLASLLHAGNDRSFPAGWWWRW